MLPIHGVSTGSNSRWALSKRHKKDSKHKMSTNRGISPSLSITLWSHMKKKTQQRRFQGLHQLTGGAAVNKGGGGKKDGSRKRKIGLSTKKDGWKKEGRVLEEAPPTEPISSCHKSFLLGK